MKTLGINQVPAADAEDLIAVLWRALEERRLPSPGLDVSLNSAGLSLNSAGLNLKVEFDSERDADLVTRVVPHFASSLGSD